MHTPDISEKKGQTLSEPQVADGSYAETCSYTPEEERRVVRKLDLVILPMVITQCSPREGSLRWN